MPSRSRPTEGVHRDLPEAAQGPKDGLMGAGFAENGRELDAADHIVAILHAGSEPSSIALETSWLAIANAADGTVTFVPLG